MVMTLPVNRNYSKLLKTAMSLKELPIKILPEPSESSLSVLNMEWLTRNSTGFVFQYPAPRIDGRLPEDLKHNYIKPIKEVLCFNDL